MNRSAFIQHLVPQAVLDARAYEVPDATGLIKLDAMENPYQWPIELRQGLAARLAEAPLNRYPDPKAKRLEAPLRRWMRIPDTLECVFGNGSDELIGLLVSLLIGSGRTVCAPDPSFVMFRVLARQYGVAFEGLPLSATHDIALDDWLSVLARCEPGILFVPQPNNPTGGLFDPGLLSQIIEATEALVVIDEAYTAFTDSDCLTWALDYPNVVVMRTLSKVGLAGARLGMLIGAPAWINEFDKVRLPYNINVLSQIAVEFALEHADLLDQQSQWIRAERARLSALLRGHGWHVWPSEANFVVVETGDASAKDIHARLKQQGVLVKCLDGMHPSLANTLRITVGSPADTEALMVALAQLPIAGR